MYSGVPLMDVSTIVEHDMARAKPGGAPRAARFRARGGGDKRCGGCKGGACAPTVPAASHAPPPFVCNRRARTKVAELDGPVGADEHVLGLHVAVDDAVGVEVVQRVDLRGTDSVCAVLWESMGDKGLSLCWSRRRRPPHARTAHGTQRRTSCFAMCCTASGGDRRSPSPTTARTRPPRAPHQLLRDVLHDLLGQRLVVLEHLKQLALRVL